MRFKPLGTMERVQQATADFFGVTVRDLKSDRRDAKVVRARHVAMFLCRTDLSMTFEQIGRAFGNRDHTTIVYGCRKIEKELARP